MANEVGRTGRDDALEVERRFIRVVCHDLRNPVSAIVMTASFLLRRGGFDSQTRRALQRILKSGTRVTRLIGDLGDFTECWIGEGIRLEPRPGDLHEIVRKAIEAVCETPPENPVLVHPEGDGAGHWDSRRLSQIVTYLVDGVLAQDPTASIEVASVGGQGGARLEVHAQEGPAAVAARLERASVKDPEGAGDPEERLDVGRCVVQQLVGAHGGTLQVESPGEGRTIFVVRLPPRPDQGGVT